MEHDVHYNINNSPPQAPIQSQMNPLTTHFSISPRPVFDIRLPPTHIS